MVCHHLLFIRDSKHIFIDNKLIRHKLRLLCCRIFRLLCDKITFLTANLCF
jgi:hypothetical protein